MPESITFAKPTSTFIVCRKCGERVYIESLQVAYKCCPKCDEPDPRYWDEPQWSSDFFPGKDEQG